MKPDDVLPQVYEELRRLAAAGFSVAGFTAGLTVTVLGLGTAQVWWLTLVGLAVLAFAVTAKGRYGTRPSIIVRQRIEAADGK